MTISLSNAGKRYNREWIFRNLSYEFQSGQAYAITGANGSGKSTLLQVLGGALMHNEGKIEYTSDQAIKIASEHIYRHVSLCAPYLDLIEEMTLREFLDFHQQFKPLLSGIESQHIIDILGLQTAKEKQIRYFSSGMKQRVKLAQCILAQSEIVLLDEPCTNLDEAGIQLYHQLIQDYAKNRIVVVSSNDEIEYRFATRKLLISDYK